MNNVQKLLFHLITDASSYTFIAKYKLTDAIVSSEYKILFRLLIAFFGKYKSIPTAEEVNEIMTGSANYDSKQKEFVINQYFDLRSKTDSSTIEFVIDTLIKENKERVVRETLVLAADQLEKGDISSVVDLLKSGTTEYDKVNQDTKRVDVRALGTASLDVYEKAKKHDNSRSVPVGFKTLDLTTGGIQPGELWVILGWLKGGKSICMLNMAYSAWTCGKNVLYISGELHPIPLKRRFDARATGLTYDSLKFGNLSPEDEQIYIDHLRDCELKENYFNLYYEAGCRTSSVEAQINELASIGKKPDLIICDYLKVMTPRDKGNARNEKIGNVALELRNIAGTYQIPIITANQINKEGYKKGEAGSEHSGDSVDIPQHADLVLGISVRDIEMKQRLRNRWEIDAVVTAARDSSECSFTCDVFSDKMLMREK